MKRKEKSESDDANIVGATGAASSSAADITATSTADNAEETEEAADTTDPTLYGWFKDGYPLTPIYLSEPYSHQDRHTDTMVTEFGYFVIETVCWNPDDGIPCRKIKYLTYGMNDALAVAVYIGLRVTPYPDRVTAIRLAEEEEVRGFLRVSGMSTDVQTPDVAKFVARKLGKTFFASKP